MRATTLTLLLLFAASTGHAQANYDGTWSGTAGDWSVTLSVAGTKAKLKMTCFGNKYDFDIPVSATGQIDTYVRAPDMGRRQLTGQLPSFTVSPGGSCRPGATTLTREK